MYMLDSDQELSYNLSKNLLLLPRILKFIEDMVDDSTPLIIGHEIGVRLNEKNLIQGSLDSIRFLWHSQNHPIYREVNPHGKVATNFDLILWAYLDHKQQKKYIP